jgi:hypothetical protein
MKTFANVLCASLLAAGILMSLSCGKKTDQGKESQSTQAEATTPANVDSLPLTSVPFMSELSASGYEPAFYAAFPSTVPARAGRVMLYRSASGGSGGGMLYVEREGPDEELVWHWYFQDDVPKAVVKEEVNGDGLWDIRVLMANKKEQLFLQEKDFALTGGGRPDRIALNGESSQPAGPEFPLFRCFDQDSTTAWRASMGGAFVEVAAPLGVRDGILVVQSAETARPKDCEVLADGKRIDRITLKDTDKKQLVELNPAVRTAKKVRIVFQSVYGSGNQVAVAEIGIR